MSIFQRSSTWVSFERSTTAHCVSFRLLLGTATLNNLVDIALRSYISTLVDFSAFYFIPRPSFFHWQFLPHVCFAFGQSLASTTSSNVQILSGAFSLRIILTGYSRNREMASCWSTLWHPMCLFAYSLRVSEGLRCLCHRIIASLRRKKPFSLPLHLWPHGGRQHLPDRGLTGHFDVWNT